MIHILNETHSIGNQMLLELRDKRVQQDRMRFRKNVERLGTIMAYEISKTLAYHAEPVETPLGLSSIHVLNKQPVLITVLRAGFPYFEGFLQVFDQAESGFIGAFRNEGDSQISISLNYVATPSLESRDVILADPMLATGKSFIKSMDALLKYGRPAHVHIAALVAAPEGVAYLEQKLTLPHTLWTWALDEKLNENFYIVPGLGDAGDLSYGEKI